MAVPMAGVVASWRENMSGFDVDTKVEVLLSGILKAQLISIGLLMASARDKTASEALAASEDLVVEVHDELHQISENQD